MTAVEARNAQSLRRGLYAIPLCALLTLGTTTLAPAEEIHVADSEFVVTLEIGEGQLASLKTTVVPLIPDKACYGWRINLAGPEGLVRVTELFTLPDTPEEWGGVDGNAFSPTQLSADRRTSTTTQFFTPDDGWISHGWCVAEGDPPGAYDIKVYVGDQLLEHFAFTVQPVRVPAAP